MRVRRSNSHDLFEVFKIIQLNLSEVNSKDYPIHVIEYMKNYYSLENLKKWLSDRRCFLVAEVENKVLGCIMLDVNEIKGLYIHPQQQHQGLGRALLKALESNVKNETLILYSSITAYGFYKSMGYESFEKVDDPYMGEAYLMKKEIL